MSKTLTEVSRDAAELSVAEQLKLARMLLEMSEQNPGPLEAVQDSWDEVGPVPNETNQPKR